MSASHAIVVRTSSLGDVVLATAVIEALTREIPRVSLLTSRAYTPLFAEDDRLAHVWSLEDDAGGGSTGGIAAFARARRERDAVVVDLQGSARGRWLALQARAQYVAPPRDGVARRFLVRNGAWGLPGRLFSRRAAEPAYRRMQRAIAGLVDAECLRSASPRLVVSTAARARAHAIAAPHDARLIVACCGARGEKRWPAASYDALARALTARDEVHVALVDDSGPEPSSLKVVDRPYGRIVRVRGALGSVVALLAAADLVIAGDTGLAHAASAAGVPVVRIFGPTTTALGFPPLGARDRVVEAPLACRPCSVHGTRPCWRGDRACLTSIDPRDVARVALESLEGAGT